MRRLVIYFKSEEDAVDSRMRALKTHEGKKCDELWLESGGYLKDPAIRNELYVYCHMQFVTLICNLFFYLRAVVPLIELRGTTPACPIW